MIVQLVGDIRVEDVISTTALSAHHDLIERGVPAAVCAGAFRSEDQKDLVTPFSILNCLTEDDVVVLHFGTLGFNYVREFVQADCQKVLFFYGVLDPTCFDVYDNHLGDIYQGTLRQLVFLSDKVDVVFSVSEWADSELVRTGFACSYQRHDPAISEGRRWQGKISEEHEWFRGDGTRLLAYGPVMPNRCYEDVLKVFHCYKRAFDDTAKLCILGSRRSGDPYYSMLQDFISVNKICDVAFVEDERMLAMCCNRTDIFISQSISEVAYGGFIEAMRRDVPIVGYRSCSVEGIIGNAGLLLSEKASFLTAAVLNRVVRDGKLRSYLREEGRIRASQLSITKAVPAFVDGIIDLVEGVKHD